MLMKRFLLFIVFMLLTATGFSLSAQTDISSSQANTRLRSTASNNTKGPRMPSGEWVDCSYDNGILILSSSEQTIITGLIIIDENNLIQTFCLNDSYEMIPVKINSGAVLIKCYTVDGCEYEGYLYLS